MYELYKEILLIGISLKLSHELTFANLHLQRNFFYTKYGGRRISARNVYITVIKNKYFK